MKAGICTAEMNTSQSISASNECSDTRFDDKIRILRYLALKALQAVESLAESPMSRESEIMSDEVRRFEVDLIRIALQKANGNQKQAAELLSLKRTTLSDKIKRYGITVVRPHYPNSSLRSKMRRPSRKSSRDEK